MRDIEARLRDGMAQNGITGEAQDASSQSITSFALYGFPESHAASFALLAYASAYSKCHYLAAFTCAMLNNQPMGFYAPAVLVKDAQRHGLRVLPVDIVKSEWDCTLEDMNLRLGLRYVKGLRAEAGSSILPSGRTRPSPISMTWPGAFPSSTKMRCQNSPRGRAQPTKCGPSPGRALESKPRRPQRRAASCLTFRRMTRKPRFSQ